MNESNVMKIIAALLVTGVAWTMGGVSTLKANDSAQEVHIQNGIEFDNSIQSRQALQGERIASLEASTAGITALLDTVVKNQDRILNKLDGR